MPIGSRKSAGNIEINRGSILLLFTDHEAEIARDWQCSKKHGDAKDTATPPELPI